MEKYFLQFDFWNGDVNKFSSSILDVDISDVLLIDLCRDIVRDSFPGIDVYSLTIKINAFNKL